MKNEIIDSIFYIDNIINKKIFHKNKIYSFQLFDLLNSNKYYRYMIKNKSMYILLFNITIIILKEICQIISIELNYLDKKFDEELINKKNKIIDKNSIYLKKIFYHFIIIYNKKIEDNDYEKNENIFLNFLNVYIDNMPYDLFAVLFNKLTPSIIELFPLLNKKCKYILLMSLFSIEKNEKIKTKIIFLIKLFFNYYSDNIYQTGNSNIKSLSNYDTKDESLIILKSIYKNKFEIINNNNFESYILPIIIDYFTITKNTNNPINFIFILGHIFNYFKIYYRKNTVENNSELNNIVYPIIKYLYNLSKYNPLFKLYTSEIIIKLPFELLSDLEYSEIVLSSIIVILEEKKLDLFELCLSKIDYLLNFIIKNPTCQIIWLEKKSSEVINLLLNLLDKEKKISKFLIPVLRVMSRLFIFSNGYNPQPLSYKKYPDISNIMKISLIEKNNCNNIKINYMLGNIIDFYYNSKNIYKYINYNSALIKDKILNYDNSKKNKFINEDELYLYLIFYKKCVLFYFDLNKLEYIDILNFKKSLINNIQNNMYTENLNEKIDDNCIHINKIYSESERELFKKIFKGYFYNFSLLSSVFADNNSFENNKEMKEINSDNDIIIKKLYKIYQDECFFFDFICERFILILLYKNNNNEYNDIFELDPLIILECIFSFLKYENNNFNYINEFSIKMINKIIDIYFQFFDNDMKIINNLEITKIIYQKFFDFININQKLPISNLYLLEILITKFDKSINKLYLKNFLRCITIITYSYPEMNDINNIEDRLMKFINTILNKLLVNDNNYYNLNLNNNNNIEDSSESNEAIEIVEENEIDENKNNKTFDNFYDFFDFIRLWFDEINTNINSKNYNFRKINKYMIDKFLIIFPQLKKIIAILFQIDYDKLNIQQFYEFFMITKNFKNPSQILSKINNVKSGLMNLSEYINKKSVNESYDKKLIMPFFRDTKIFKKIEENFKTLTTKINIKEKNLIPFISSLDSLITYFEYCPELINEFIFCYNKKNNNNFLLYIDVIKCCYYNIILDNYLIKDLMSYENNEIKNIYLILEKLLDNNNVEYLLKINIKNKLEYLKIDEEIPFSYLEYIEKELYNNNNANNINNVRDDEIYQIYDLVKYKTIMISKYIKLLTHLINNKYIKISLNNISDEYVSDYQKYKNRIIQIIIYILLNRAPNIIIKEATSLLIESLNNDKQLKNNITKNYSYYIQNLNIILIDFNNENIDKSNCSVNLDYSKGLQLKHLDFINVVCKAKLLDNEYINILLNKLQLFEKIFMNQKINNSILLLYYRYISIIYYIQSYEDITIDKHIETIFNHLIEINKIIDLQPSDGYIFFNKTKDFKKIAKFFMKNKNILINLIIKKSSKSHEWKNVFNFLKKVIKFESMSLIFEALFKEIVENLKKNLFNKENINVDSNNMDVNIVELQYLIKICKIIGYNYPVYLQSYSLIEKGEMFFYKNRNILEKYEKLAKYWIDICIINLKIFNFNSTNIFFLIHYYSYENLAKYIKQKIDVFLSNEFINLINAKSIVNIINKYIKSKKEINLDLIINKLVIPLLIKYSSNFFSSQSQINGDNNDNKDNNNNYISNSLTSLISKILVKITTYEEIKTEAIYKLLSLIIIIYKIFKDKKIFNEQIKRISQNIKNILTKLEAKNKKAFPEYIFLCKTLCETLTINKDLSNTFITQYKKFNIRNNDIKNIINEILLFYCSNNQIILEIFKNILNENKTNKYNFLKILVDNPILINQFFESKEKIIYLNEITIILINEINGFNKLLYKEKIIIMNLIGLIVSHRKKLLTQTFSLLYKLILDIIQNILYDSDINNTIDNQNMIELLLFYYRELLKIYNVNYIFKLNIDIKEIKFDYCYYYYLLFLKINLLNIPLDQIYSNINEYITIYDALIEKNKEYFYNKILLNEYIFILRLLTQKDLSEKMNNGKYYNNNLFLNYQIYMYFTFNKIIDELYENKENIINYGIKDSNIQNIFYIDSNNLVNNYIFPYLIKNNYYIQKKDINHPFIENNINNFDNYNNYNDSWLDTFPLNNFCYFTCYYKYFDEFYSERKHSQFKSLYQNYSLDYNFLSQLEYLNNNLLTINNSNTKANSDIITNSNVNNYTSTNVDKNIIETSNNSNINTINDSIDQGKNNNTANILTLNERKNNIFFFINNNFINLRKKFDILVN